MGRYVLVRNGMEFHPETGIGGVREEGVLCLANDLLNDSGVVDVAGGDLLVTELGSPVMKVNVAIGRLWIKNSAWVKNTYDSNKFYPCLVDSIQELDIDSNSSGLTRNDIVVAKVDLSIDPGDSGEYAVTVYIVKGTDGGGVPSTPANCSKLAEIEVGDGVTAIYTANITDTRGQLELSGSFCMSPQSIGNTINGSDAKTDPHDDDMFGLMDSEASNILKKFSWANLKAKFGLFINSLIAGYELEEMTTPSTPASGKGRIYVKDNGGVSALYFLNDNGDEVQLGVGSSGSGVGLIYRQALFNAGSVIYQLGAAITLTDAKLFGGSDGFYAKGEGTAVSAGTIEQLANPDVGTTGYADKLSGVTLTGAGKVHGYRFIESLNAKAYKNKTASFSVNVRHDVGSAIDFVIKINKANSADNFSATTNIATASAQSVLNNTETLIKFENVSLGDCSNGIEIEIEADCGAITSKNFQLGNWQFNEGETVLDFACKQVQEEEMDSKRYYQKITSVVASEAICLCVAYSTTQGVATFPLERAMMKIPTLAVSDVTDFRLSDSTAAYDTTGVVLNSNMGRKTAALNITVASGLTQFRPYSFNFDATIGRYIALDARPTLV